MVRRDAVVLVATRFLRGITEGESAVQRKDSMGCRIFLTGHANFQDGKVTKMYAVFFVPTRLHRNEKPSLSTNVMDEMDKWPKLSTLPAINTSVKLKGSC